MILGTVLFNGVMGLVFIITYVRSTYLHTSCSTDIFSPQCFCIPDVIAVISSESPFPFIDVRCHGSRLPPPITD